MLSLLARFRWIVVALAAGVAGCDIPPPPLTPRAQAVQVLKADPPEGSTDLGTITAYDGTGCGVMTSDGTFDGAVLRIRNEAAARGGNYVQMVGIIEPHQAGDCHSNTFTLLGRLFRVSAKPTAAPRPGRADACDPPCSPGYECESGTCKALCNPPCEGAMVCRQDRTCGPAAGASPRGDAP